MAFINVPHTALVELLYTIDNVHAENTLYFSRGQNPTLQELYDLADIMANWWYLELRKAQGNHLLFRGVNVRSLAAENAYSVFTPLHYGELGAEPGGWPVPNNVACCISFRTTLRGRSFRGRNYSVGMKSNMFENNRIVQWYNNDLKAAYLKLFTGVGYIPSEWTWVVVSRFANHQPRENGVYTPVVAVTYTDTILDSQRKRLPGRGD